CLAGARTGKNGPAGPAGFRASSERLNCPYMTAMTDALPLSQTYNLARLGNAGDAVTVTTDEAQRAAIARWAGVLSIEAFSAAVDIRKLAPTRFGLTFAL